MYSARYDNPYHSSTYQHYYTYEPSPSSKHKRRATADGAYHQPPPYATYYYTTAPEDSKPKRSSSHRHRDHVSSGDRHKSHHKRHPFVYTTGPAFGQDPYRSGDQYYTYQQQSAYYVQPGDDYATAYERKYRTSPPPFAEQSFSYPAAYADGYTYHAQTHQYPSNPPPRERRASYAQPQYASRPTQPKQPTPPAPAATSEDARKAGIPAGFSLKHWDPREEPILLLGSVFDANSLGKWIYDWTVACHGPGTPLTEVSGDLWLLLIQLAGKMKRAETKLPRMRNRDDKEMIDDYLESGERLWERFSKLLKLAETYMLKVAKKKSSSSKKTVGPDSGIQFVKCLFGRDHELERTEKIMTAMRLWSRRFDVNCEDLLRKP